MKDLILSNCNHLIKFILFGDEENDDSIGDDSKERKKNEKKEFKIKHIPKSKLWRKGYGYIKINDLMSSNNNQDEILENEIPGNDLELAIYHYKGKLWSFYYHMYHIVRKIIFYL